MSVLDFLFEGRPPASVTTYGQTVENVPKWMSDYTQGLISRANSVAAEGYIPYEGPRIAGFDPDQLQAFEQTRENQGNYQPFFDESAQMSYDNATNSPLAAAQPALDQAGERFIDNGNPDSYMSPYVDNVLNRQGDLAMREMNERFIPGLQKAFIGAGSFGSRGPGNESMETVGVRGTRDIMENLQSQQNAYLDQAYTQAGARFDADQARRMQVAQQTGQLATAESELGLRGAQQLGTLGQMTQQAGALDAAALESVGNTQRQLPQQSLDLAYSDFLEQRNLPRQNVGFLSDIIRGLPSQGGTTTSSNTGPLGDSYQASPLAQLSSAYGLYRGLNGDD